MSNGNLKPTKRDWNGIGWIILAGALGGFLSWLYSLILKQPLCDSALLALTCSVLFGVVAGGIGVYVFNLLDQNRFARTFFIAIVFGFVWKPVVEAIPAYVKKTTLGFVESDAKDTAARTAEASQKLGKLEPQGDPEVAKSQIRTATDEAVKAVAALPDVKSSTQTHEAVAQSAINAADTIGQLAIKGSDPSVKKEATEALNKLGAAA